MIESNCELIKSLQFGEQIKNVTVGVQVLYTFMKIDEPGTEIENTDNQNEIMAGPSQTNYGRPSRMALPVENQYNINHIILQEKIRQQDVDIVKLIPYT